MDRLIFEGEFKDGRKMNGIHKRYYHKKILKDEILRLYKNYIIDFENNYILIGNVICKNREDFEWLRDYLENCEYDEEYKNGQIFKGKFDKMEKDKLIRD